MVTSIARGVQRILRDHPGDMDAEIVFPVASEAIAPSEDPLLRVIPGVASGEGCTVAGGCATCPYMKMNSLDALFDLLQVLDRGPEALAPYEPKKYAEQIDGRSVAEVGAESIVAMRQFQKTGELPADLVEKILAEG
jgi:quinolinate synthase